MKRSPEDICREGIATLAVHADQQKGDVRTGAAMKCVSRPRSPAAGRSGTGGDCQKRGGSEIRRARGPVELRVHVGLDPWGYRVRGRRRRWRGVSFSAVLRRAGSGRRRGRQRGQGRRAWSACYAPGIGSAVSPAQAVTAADGEAPLAAGVVVGVAAVILAASFHHRPRLLADTPRGCLRTVVVLVASFRHRPRLLAGTPRLHTRLKYRSLRHRCTSLHHPCS